MSYYSQSDQDKDVIQQNLKESIKLLQEIIFRRMDNKEYSEEYYSTMRKSLVLLNEAYELLF